MSRRHVHAWGPWFQNTIIRKGTTQMGYNRICTAGCVVYQEAASVKGVGVITRGRTLSKSMAKRISIQKGT